MPTSASTRAPLPVKPPGRSGLPALPGQRTHVLYELGDRKADRAWNRDGLSLSVEARLSSSAQPGTSSGRVRMRAGLEGLEAKIGLVRDGEPKLRFEGLSLKEGFFRGQLSDAGDYLKERPVLAAGAVVGAFAAAQAVASKSGPIKVDTGRIKFYDHGALTAAVVGEVAITGDKHLVSPRGASLRVGYRDASAGNFSMEAGYDREVHTQVRARWHKQLAENMNVEASAYYDERPRNAGVNFSLVGRF